MRIKNFSLLRLINFLLPLKGKWKFLFNKQLKEGASITVPYNKDWKISFIVKKGNESTISEVILEGVRNLPEYHLVQKIKNNELGKDIVLVDVGGNIGSFFSQFYDISMRIIVFEPIPDLASTISRSIAGNNDSKVLLHTLAIGDKPGMIYMADSNNASVNLNSVIETDLHIEVSTLDIMLSCEPVIDFIKIDVEGYEWFVINGAREIIAKCKPLILLELHPQFINQYGKSVDDIIDILTEFGYDIIYYNYLEERRMNRVSRIFNRWSGNKGIQFQDKEAFYADIDRKPLLTSYHLLCKPL